MKTRQGFICVVFIQLLNLVSCTKLWCDIEQATASTAGSGVSYWYDFNCNNDATHIQEAGKFNYFMVSLLPCSGCNEWYYSKNSGYAIKPSQNSDKPAHVWIEIKWNGKTCNAGDLRGKSGTYTCNV
jgi:hypothetical protein